MHVVDITLVKKNSWQVNLQKTCSEPFFNNIFQILRSLRNSLAKSYVRRGGGLENLTYPYMRVGGGLK